MNMTSEKKVWTEAELLRLPKEEGRHELVGGKLVVMPLFGFKEAELVAALIAELGNVVQETGFGTCLCLKPRILDEQWQSQVPCRFIRAQGPSCRYDPRRRGFPLWCPGFCD